MSSNGGELHLTAVNSGDGVNTEGKSRGGVMDHSMEVEQSELIGKRLGGGDDLLRYEPLVEPVNGVVQPPFRPTKERPGRATNQLKFLKETVLQSLWRHEFSWIFQKPVDAVKLKLPDYHQIIKRPMDLGTIKKRLGFRYYWTARECIDDFQTMFTNCITYNSLESDAGQMSSTLFRIFTDKVRDMPEEEKEIVVHPKKGRKDKKSRSKAGVATTTPLLASGNPAHNCKSLQNETTALGVGEESTRSEGAIIFKSGPSQDQIKNSNINCDLSLSTSMEKPKSSADMCREILNELLSIRHAEYGRPFYNTTAAEKLDPRGTLKVVGKSMDLGKIKQNMDNGLYKSTAEFAADVRLMFTNCYQYNLPHSEMVTKAKQLQEVFEKAYVLVPDDEPYCSSSGDEFSGESSSDDESSRWNEGDEITKSKRLENLFLESRMYKEQMRLLQQSTEELTKKRESKKRQLAISDNDNLPTVATKTPRARSPEIEGKESTEIDGNCTAEAGEVNDLTKPMPFEEMRLLCSNVSRLSSEELSGLVAILQSREPSSLQRLHEPDRLEFSYETLETSTLRELQAYVGRCMGKKGEELRAEDGGFLDDSFSTCSSSTDLEQ